MKLKLYLHFRLKIVSTFPARLVRGYSGMAVHGAIKLLVGRDHSMTATRKMIIPNTSGSICSDEDVELQRNTRQVVDVLCVE